MALNSRHVTIRDLGRVITGRTPPGNDSRYYGEKIPFLTPSDISDGRRVTRTARSLSDYGAQQLARCLVPRGVGVSCIGWQMGKSIVIDCPTITNQQINSIIVNEEVADRDFVYYALLGRRSEIFQLGAGGSRTPILNKSDFERFSIELPLIQTQRTVASVLRSLDDKIELNRRMNETLEAMARALFESWFVNLDPVRAKAEGRATGLPPHLDALFPDSFEESDLREVPKGWECGRLSDLCSAIFSGGTPSTMRSEYWNGGIPWLSSGETRSAFVIETEKTISHGGVIGSSTRLAQSGSTVIAGAGQGHTRGQTSMLMLDTYINQSVVALEANKDVSSDCFLFFDLSRRYEEFRQLSDGHSSRGSLTTKLLAQIPVIVPSRPIVEAFSLAAEPLVKMIGLRLKENRTLTLLRDGLLPKLVSGKIRVRETDSQIEAIT
jgi:type I restriction enzyme S subunit